MIAKIRSYVELLTKTEANFDFILKLIWYSERSNLLNSEADKLDIRTDCLTLINFDFMIFSYFIVKNYFKPN